MIGLTLNYNRKSEYRECFEFVELITSILHTPKAIFLVQLNQKFQHLSKTKLQTSLHLYPCPFTSLLLLWKQLFNCLLSPTPQLCFWSHPLTFWRPSLQQWMFPSLSCIKHFSFRVIPIRNKDQKNKGRGLRGTNFQL